MIKRHLGGSAPRLRHFSLNAIPFPGLPKLLLSANHLVALWLTDIPHSGYISPEAMVALISVLSSLETLLLGFQSPQSRPDTSLHPPKRSILPALTRHDFRGVTEYLEQLVVRIDAPQLDEMHTTFFNQIDFDCPRLAQFIDRTPTLRALNEAHVQFNDSTANVTLRYWASKFGFDNLQISISCRGQLSSIEQVCNFSLRPLSTVEDLYIEHRIRNWFGRVMLSRTPYGCNSYFHLPRRPISTYPKNLRQVSRPPCKSSLGAEQQKYCPACRIFSWRRSSHRDLSRRILGSSLPRDSSPITLSSFLTGTKTPTWSRCDAPRKLQHMLSSFHVHLFSL